MANERKQALQQRQAQLIARSAELRRALGQQAQALQTPLKLADQALTVAQWLCRHPLWPLAAALLFALSKPRRTLGWGSRLWWAWRLFNAAKVWLKQPT